MDYILPPADSGHSIDKITFNFYFSHKGLFSLCIVKFKVDNQIICSCTLQQDNIYPFGSIHLKPIIEAKKIHVIILAENFVTISWQLVEHYMDMFVGKSTIITKIKLISNNNVPQEFQNEGNMNAFNMQQTINAVHFIQETKKNHLYVKVTLPANSIEAEQEHMTHLLNSLTSKPDCIRKYTFFEVGFGYVSEIEDNLNSQVANLPRMTHALRRRDEEIDIDDVEEYQNEEIQLEEAMDDDF